MGSHNEWLISMGSDIQFPAISANGYDSLMSHADERTLSIISDKFRITLFVAFCRADMFAG